MRENPPAGDSKQDKARSRRGHLLSVAVCGGIFLAAGLWAARIAGSGPSTGVPLWLRLASRRRRAPPPPSLPEFPRASSAPRWRAWDAPAFDEARRRGRLVLLHLGNSWSRWPRLMEETSYADPRVSSWIEGNAVPVRVDAGARPDLARRYLAGGWPETALLLPSGETLSSAHYLPPERFLDWGGRVVDAYRRDPESLLQARERAELRALEARRRLLLEPRSGAWETGEAPVLARARLARLRAEGGDGKERFLLENRLRFLLEATAGGWLGAPRLLRRELDSALSLEDPVWGGFHRSRAADGEGGALEYEKLAEQQGLALEAFAFGYALLGEARYRDAALRTAAYIEKFLRLPQGGYGAARSAFARAPSGAYLEGKVYNALPGPERLAAGSPELDRSEYAAANARLAEAYLSAGRALGSPEFKRRGLDLARRLWSRGADSAGRVRHELPSGKAGGLLEDQLAASRLFLAAFRETGRRVELDRARSALSWALERLRDPASGGLLPAPGDASWPDPAAAGRGLADPDGSASAALLLAELARASGRAEELELARRLTGWVLPRRGLVDADLLARLALGRPDRPRGPHMPQGPGER